MGMVSPAGVRKEMEVDFSELLYIFYFNNKQIRHIQLSHAHVWSVRRVNTVQTDLVSTRGATFSPKIILAYSPPYPYCAFVRRLEPAGTSNLLERLSEETVPSSPETVPHRALRPRLRGFV